VQFSVKTNYNIQILYDPYIQMLAVINKVTVNRYEILKSIIISL